MAMYSIEWFEKFAATVPSEIVETEVAGIAAALPPARYPRVLDIGCGIGRIAGPLSSIGYSVTGLDINLDAHLTRSVDAIARAASERRDQRSFVDVALALER